MSDEIRICINCGESFIFSYGEQRYYREHNLSEPKRCPNCRSQRRAQYESGNQGFSGLPERRVIDERSDLQYQVKAWHDQAARGEISYRDLADRIRETSDVLRTEFGRRKLEWKEYETRIGYLVLTDNSGQSWRLFQDGTWRQSTPNGWKIGEPDLFPKAVNLQAEGFYKRYKRQIILFFIIVTASLLVSIVLDILLNNPIG